jgi:hypothetical protein
MIHTVDSMQLFWINNYTLKANRKNSCCQFSQPFLENKQINVLANRQLCKNLNITKYHSEVCHKNALFDLFPNSIYHKQLRNFVTHVTCRKSDKDVFNVTQIQAKCFTHTFCHLHEKVAISIPVLLGFHASISKYTRCNPQHNLGEN